MSIRHITLGVLDIQGSVAEHLAALRQLNVSAVAVKTKAELDRVDGLILPGGESTTIGKLMKRFGLDEEIRRRVLEHSLALWGTCAGAILMAKKVRNQVPDTLRLMNIDIERNAYGRQLDSFETELAAPELNAKNLRAIFIRAPRIRGAAQTVTVLARHENESVMLREDNMLVSTFHPELTDDTRVHQYFVSLTKTYAKK